MQEHRSRRPMDGRDHYNRAYQKKDGARPAQEKLQGSEAAEAMEAEGILEGRNAVTEALKAGRTFNKLLIAAGDTDWGLGRIAAQAREKGILVQEIERSRMDAISLTGVHQGVIAYCAAHEYSTVDEMLALAAERGEPPLLVICDDLSDPHNLGAILRTAECAGAHGVIIPKRRSAALTPTVAKASAGAVEYMKVARVTNLNTTIEKLKKQGVWIFGTAADGAIELTKADLKGPAAIIIGSEGDGMRRLVTENCDFKVSIPMRGHIDSLNASVAAAVLLYEAVRQRGQASE